MLPQESELDELALEVGQLRITVSRREGYGSSPLRVDAVSSRSTSSQLPSQGAFAGPDGATEPVAHEDVASLRSWSEVEVGSVRGRAAPWTKEWFEGLASADSPSKLEELDLAPISHLESRLRTTSAG